MGSLSLVGLSKSLTLVFSIFDLDTGDLTIMWCRVSATQVFSERGCEFVAQTPCKTQGSPGHPLKVVVSLSQPLRFYIV